MDPGDQDRVARSHILEAYVREKMEEKAYILIPIRGPGSLAISTHKWEALPGHASTLPYNRDILSQEKTKKKIVALDQYHYYKALKYYRLKYL